MGTRDTVMNKKSSWSHEANILLVEIMKQVPKHIVQYVIAINAMSEISREGIHSDGYVVT